VHDLPLATPRWHVTPRRTRPGPPPDPGDHLPLGPDRRPSRLLTRRQ
jgi:hypothetical protein